MIKPGLNDWNDSSWTLVYQIKVNPGESRGLVVKAEDSQLSGCGFEPQRRILDGVSEASYYKLQWKKK